MNDQMTIHNQALCQKPPKKHPGAGNADLRGAVSPTPHELSKNKPTKLYKARNHPFDGKLKPKSYVRAQSMPLGTYTKFQLETFTRSMTSALRMAEE